MKIHTDSFSAFFQAASVLLPWDNFHHIHDQNHQRLRLPPQGPAIVDGSKSSEEKHIQKNDDETRNLITLMGT